MAGGQNNSLLARIFFQKNYEKFRPTIFYNEN